MEDSTEKKIFRNFALPLSTFEYLKQFQRDYLERNKVAINNNNALAILLDQHKQLYVESEAHAKPTPR